MSSALRTDDHGMTTVSDLRTLVSPAHLKKQSRRVSIPPAFSDFRRACQRNRTLAGALRNMINANAKRCLPYRLHATAGCVSPSAREIGVTEEIQ